MCDLYFMFCVVNVMAILPCERGRSGSVPPQSPPGKFCLAGKRLRLRRKKHFNCMATILFRVQRKLVFACTIKTIKLEKTSFQNSELEGISPSRRTCFFCVCLELDSQEHLSRPPLIPETEKKKWGKCHDTCFYNIF